MGGGRRDDSQGAKMAGRLWRDRPPVSLSLSLSIYLSLSLSRVRSPSLALGLRAPYFEVSLASCCASTPAASVALPESDIGLARDWTTDPEKRDERGRNWRDALFLYS